MRYALYNGTKKIDSVYAGGHEIRRIYKGDRLIWEKPSTVDDGFKFEYSGGSYFGVTGDNLKIFIEDGSELTYSRDSVTLPDGEHTVTVKGDINWISFASSTVTRVLSVYPASMSAITEAKNMFKLCSKLTYLPPKLFSNCPNIESFYWCFWYCSSLTEIPGDLFAYCPGAYQFTSCFGSCKRLQSIPSMLFNYINTSKRIDFFGCFLNDASLMGSAPKLWEMYPNANGAECFEGCNKLSNYNEIPNSWKGA